MRRLQYAVKEDVNTKRITRSKTLSGQKGACMDQESFDNAVGNVEKFRMLQDRAAFGGIG